MSSVLDAMMDEAPPVAAEGDVYAFPLLPHQRRLWQDAEGGLGGRTQINAFCLSLTGLVDHGILRATLDVLIQRHEALRSTCAETPDGPVLLIAADGTAAFRVIDLRARPLTEIDAEVEKHCAEEARRTFDLKTGPLARFVLIRSASTTSYLLMTFHQMIADGWSVALLMDEIATTYQHFADHGHAPQSPPPGVQFGDYMAWYHDYLLSSEAEAGIGSQVARLQDYRRFDLQPDKPDSLDDGDSAIVTRELPLALTDAIANRNAASGDTMFMTAAAACLAVLHADTGRCDVSVGTPVAQRNRTELEPVVGNLLDHAIFAAAVQPSMTLAELLAQARRATLDMLVGETMPIESVASAFAATTGRRYDPFFSICLSCQRAFAGGGAALTYDFAGLHMATMPSKATGSSFDLFFFMVQRECGWRLSLDYRVARFSEARADALIDAFVSVLHSLVERPETRLCDLVRPGHSTDPIKETVDEARPAQAAGEPPDAPLAVGDDGLFAGLASFAQERYWLLAKAMPDSSIFNMPARLRIRGAVSADALERGLQSLVARHMILRTTFEESDEGLLQVVRPRVTIPLVRQDLSGLPIAEREAALDAALAADGIASFDLERGPLVRARLIRLDPQEHYLCLTLHHIISDGASIAILQRDLWRFYEGLSRAYDAELPELPIQYIDYAGCQKEWVDTDAAKLQLQYWLNRLQTPLPVLDIAADHVARRRGSAKPALLERALPADLVERMKSVCAREGATMFSVTAACFATLLSRMSGGEDILFACPSDNRGEQMAQVIGPVASLFAMRLDLHDDPLLSDVTNAVSEAIINAHANREIPFERVVAGIDAPAQRGRNPLFQFFFLYQRAFLQPLALPSLTIEPLKSLAIGTPYELQVSVIERETGTTVQLEYNTDLFEEPTILKILDDYIANLELRTTQQELRLSDLPDLRRDSRAPSSDWHEAAYVAPVTDLDLSLVNCWSRVLHQDKVGLRDNFFDLGGNSFNVVELAKQIRLATGLDVSIGALFSCPTIAEFVANLDELAMRTKSVIVPLQPNGSKPPIYCLGGIEIYRDIALSLDRDQPVFGVYVSEEDQIAIQLAAGKSPTIDLDRWAGAYLEAILRLGRPGPYRLAGISAGGALAMMVASSMVKMGLDVDAVFMFDTLLADGYTRSRAHWLAKHAREMRDNGARIYQRALMAPALNADERGAVTPNEAKQKAFSAALRRWNPKDFEGGFKVVLYRAFDMISNRRMTIQREYGWARLVRERVIVEDFAGDHLSMVRHPSASGIAASIQKHLSGLNP